MVTEPEPDSEPNNDRVTGVDLDGSGVGDGARNRRRAPAVDGRVIRDAQPGPGNRGAVQIDVAVVDDRRRIAEHATACDRPGAAGVVVERGACDRDVAVDVAAVVDRDRAAGLDDRIGRRGHARGVGADGAGIVDRRGAGRVLLDGDRRNAIGADHRAGVGDVRRAGRAEIVLVDVNAERGRAGDVTVIGDGDGAAAMGDDVETDRAGRGAADRRSNIACAGRAVVQDDAVAGRAGDVANRRQRDIADAVLGDDNAIVRAAQRAGRRQHDVAAIAARPARCREVERIALRRRDVGITRDREGAAGRRLAGNGAGETMARLVELKRIGAARKGDGLGVRPAELQRRLVVDDQRADAGDAAGQVQRAALDFDRAGVGDTARNRVEAATL